MTPSRALVILVTLVAFGICGEVTAGLLSCNGVLNFCNDWNLHIGGIPLALSCCAFFARRIREFLVLMFGILLAWEAVYWMVFLTLLRVGSPGIHFALCLGGVAYGIGISFWCWAIKTWMGAQKRRYFHPIILGGLVGGVASIGFWPWGSSQYPMDFLEYQHPYLFTRGMIVWHAVMGTYLAATLFGSDSQKSHSC